MFGIFQKLFEVGCADPSASAPSAPASNEATSGVDAGCSISSAKDAWTYGENAIVKQSDNWMRVH